MPESLIAFDLNMNQSIGKWTSATATGDSQRGYGAVYRRCRYYIVYPTYIPYIEQPTEYIVEFECLVGVSAALVYCTRPGAS